MKNHEQMILVSRTRRAQVTHTTLRRPRHQRCNLVRLGAFTKALVEQLLDGIGFVPKCSEYRAVTNRVCAGKRRSPFRKTSNNR